MCVCVCRTKDRYNKQIDNTKKLSISVGYTGGYIMEGWIYHGRMDISWKDGYIMEGWICHLRMDVSQKDGYILDVLMNENYTSQINIFTLFIKSSIYRSLLS